MSGQGSEFGIRPGEERLAAFPGAAEPDGGIHFIGRIRSPWQDCAFCPKNMAEARERQSSAQAEVDVPFRRGLAGLERASHVVLLSWLDRAPRDLIVQHPRHAEHPRGVFALRSPARPNPIGLHVVRLLSLDAAAGLLRIEAIDVLDGTPLLDVKPYYVSTDSVPDAVIAKDA